MSKTVLTRCHLRRYAARGDHSNTDHRSANEVCDTLTHATLLKTHTFWFGLHALSGPSGLDELFWDTCSIPDYTAPLVEGPTVGDCVLLTYNITGAGKWWKGTPCNTPAAFICLEAQSGIACRSDCEGLIYFSTEEECLTVCSSGNCTANYLKPTGMCSRVIASVDDDNMTSVCFVPTPDLLPSAVCPDAGTFIVPSDSGVTVSDRRCSNHSLQTSTSETYDATAISKIMATTTIIAATSTESAKCECLCQQLLTFMALPPSEEVNLTVEEKIDLIVQELTIERKNTTQSIRKLVSAPDSRISSVGIGALAGGIIFSVFGLIVLIDLNNVWQDLKPVLKKMFLMLKGNKIEHNDPVATLAQRSSSFSVTLFNIVAPPPKDQIHSNHNPTRSVRRTIGFHSKDVQRRNAAVMIKRMMALESNPQRDRDLPHTEPSVNRMLRLENMFGYFGRDNGIPPPDTTLIKQSYLRW